MGACRGRLSAPWLRFHGADRADVYIIIHVRACCCGECALNPPTLPPIPRRKPSLAHAVPNRVRRMRDAFPANRTTHSPPKTSARPRTATRPSRALPLPHAAPMHAHAVPTHARRLRDARPAALTTHSPQRHAVSPSVPLRAQKNGTAQCMCDAECLGRPSLRSVIWVGEPRAVRRRCGALACRRGA